ncbi:MAG: Hsp33 family molecular chaperone HslO [Deltaproteobacteria bacterium]|nr:Hsp33 family molecular chaperone HslO [Deltaproteobacteria bacterium]
MTAARPDELLRTLSEDGSVSVRALVGSDLVREAARRHETSPVATAALGRALLGAVLIASQGKDAETVEMRFRARGPLGHVVAIADDTGRARGYVANPGLDLPLRGGRLDISHAIGLGELAVVRFRPGWREPYTGIVPIVSGEIAEDIALYLTESEQTPSAVALGVWHEPDGAPAAAGGFLVQSLPGANDEVVKRIEQNVQRLPAISRLVHDGAGAADLVALLLDGVGRRDLESSAPQFYCACDEDRVLRAAAMLGRRDLEDAMAKREQLEVRCVFCAEKYAVDPERARALLLDA